MKNICFFILTMISFSSINAQSFQISIEQGGKTVPVSGNEISLEKAPFIFHITLNKAKGIYLNAQQTDEVYKIAKKHRRKLEFMANLEKVVPEPNFNTEKNLILSRKFQSFWFYDSKIYWHPFDDVSISGDKVSAKRTVNSFYFSDTKETVTPADIVEPVFLVFLMVADPEKGNTKEIDRNFLKINWK